MLGTHFFDPQPHGALILGHTHVGYPCHPCIYLPQAPPAHFWSLPGKSISQGKGKPFPVPIFLTRQSSRGQNERESHPPKFNGRESRRVAGARGAVEGSPFPVPLGIHAPRAAQLSRSSGGPRGARGEKQFGCRPVVFRVGSHQVGGSSSSSSFYTTRKSWVFFGFLLFFFFRTRE